MSRELKHLTSFNQVPAKRAAKRPRQQPQPPLASAAEPPQAKVAPPSQLEPHYSSSRPTAGHVDSNTVADEDDNDSSDEDDNLTLGQVVSTMVSTLRSPQTVTSDNNDDDDDDNEEKGLTLAQVDSRMPAKRELSSSDVDSSAKGAAAAVGAKSRKKGKAAKNPKKRPREHGRNKSSLFHQQPLSCSSPYSSSSVLTQGGVPADPQIGWRVEVMNPKFGDEW